MENETPKNTKTKLTNDNVSSDASTNATTTDMILNAVGDETLLTYSDVVCESIQRQNEQLSTQKPETQSEECFIWLWKRLTSLWWGIRRHCHILNSESWVIYKIHRKHSTRLSGESKHEDEKPSACTDAVNLQMQDVTVEGDEVGNTPSNIPINRNDSDPKEVKGNRGCKRSVKYRK